MLRLGAKECPWNQCMHLGKVPAMTGKTPDAIMADSEQRRSFLFVDALGS
jgi:hypothetical protein